MLGPQAGVISTTDRSDVELDSYKNAWFSFSPSALIWSVVIALPTIKLISSELSYRCSHRFLVQGMDYIFLQFKISGNDSDYLLNGWDGPKFYYTRHDITYLYHPCHALNTLDGSCVENHVVTYQHICSCCCQTSDSIQASFNKTAETAISKETVYMRWPGPTNDIMSEIYRFPEVKVSTKAPYSA
ncbi:hypothetical protein RRG08_030236 [Elysia crispata]|uniref:Uncharacterized protein n=1 Tax=Elysia crispata TaxID=231223 RepID=A0AAE1DZZ6_9GAST|nr:hypothetical protein RRG08_030236 [Elysia crispata]